MIAYHPCGPLYIHWLSEVSGAAGGWEEESHKGPTLSSRLHIITVQTVGVRVALPAILEMICQDVVAAILIVPMLGEEDAIVGLLGGAPVMLLTVL